MDIHIELRCKKSETSEVLLKAETEWKDYKIGSRVMNVWCQLNLLDVLETKSFYFSSKKLRYFRQLTLDIKCGHQIAGVFENNKNLFSENTILKL